MPDVSVISLDDKSLRVSLCMIVRDEEKYLGQALTSLKPLVDEIIIVDTGSRDRTIEIARAYGAKIFDFSWVDDFSAARNFSISKASGKWLLTLDADEAIADPDYSKFADLPTDPTICWMFTERHYTNDPMMSGFRRAKGEYARWERSYGGYFESSRVRLFPNDPQICFRGKIHEHVEQKICELGKYRIAKSDIPIHHYGHTPEAKQEKDERKAYLYIQSGEKKINDDPSYWQNYFELGVEYSYRTLYEQSLAKFERAAELNPSCFEIYARMGYVLCEMGRYPEAMESLEQALRINPQDYETYGNLGVVFIRMEKYPLAIEALTRATEIFPEFVRGYYTLANALLRAGKAQEAVASYERTLEIYPGYTAAKVELGIVLTSLKQLNKAEQFLLSALVDDRGHTEALFHLGLIYQIQKRSSDALRIFEQFLNLSRNEKLKAQVERTCRTLRQQHSLQT
jgi:tetratricopeptide (TPR) repeat protein